MRSRLWLLLAVTAITAAVLQHSSALSPQRKPAAPVPVLKFGFDNVQRFAQQRQCIGTTQTHGHLRVKGDQGSTV